MATSGLAALACSLASARLAGAEDANGAPDKRRYNLFHPTPAQFMRELSADRPDQTESAYTVDAGHFQVEMDFVSATFDCDRSGGGDVREETWFVAPLNLKVGLLNNVDLQLAVDSYIHSRVEDRVAGTVRTASGFGDLQTRVKVNLWGNDGGRTALAMMPFVKWPLSESDLRNGKTEGGLIVPFSMELGGGWDLGTTMEVDFVANDRAGYDAEYFNTVTIGRDIVGRLGAYVEFAALVAPESDTDWQGQVDLGFTYGLNENTQFDFGCNFGVTMSAPDFHPFVGVTLRF